MFDESDLDVQTSVIDISTIITETSERILTDLIENNANVFYISHLKDFRKENPKNIIFTHLNINWFHTKFHKVHEIWSNDIVDLYIISESKLIPTIKSEHFKYFFLKDYSFYRQDQHHAIWGGSCVKYMITFVSHRQKGFNLQLRWHGVYGIW